MHQCWFQLHDYGSELIRNKESCRCFPFRSCLNESLFVSRRSEPWVSDIWDTLSLKRSCWLLRLISVWCFDGGTLTLWWMGVCLCPAVNICLHPLYRVILDLVPSQACETAFLVVFNLHNLCCKLSFCKLTNTAGGRGSEWRWITRQMQTWSVQTCSGLWLVFSFLLLLYKRRVWRCFCGRCWDFSTRLLQYNAIQNHELHFHFPPVSLPYDLTKQNNEILSHAEMSWSKTLNLEFLPLWIWHLPNADNNYKTLQ